jgi:DNA-binding phage protein
MMTPDDVRRALKDHNLSAVAKATGVSTDTLYRFMAGGTPSVRTLEKLTAYLKGKGVIRG